MPIPSESLAPRPLLRDDVHQRLRDAIVDGTLTPGERLRDQDLAVWLGVSRTPVREALLRLAQAVVAAMHRLAVEQAVPQLGPADLEAMAQANDRFADALRRGDAEAAVAADDAFHAVAVRAAANTAIESVLDQFTPVLRRLERLRFGSLSGRASVALHARIIERCAAGDAAAAADVAHETWETLRPLIESLESENA